MKRVARTNLESAKVSQTLKSFSLDVQAVAPLYLQQVACMVLVKDWLEDLVMTADYLCRCKVSTEHF